MLLYAMYKNFSNHQLAMGGMREFTLRAENHKRDYEGTEFKDVFDRFVNTSTVTVAESTLGLLEQSAGLMSEQVDRSVDLPPKPFFKKLFG